MIPRQEYELLEVSKLGIESITDLYLIVEIKPLSLLHAGSYKPSFFELWKRTK